jgi:ATPase subunit of ABC transporter with duplicated ATPase domains
MTNPYLVVKNVSYVLPDGRVLFSGLNEQFDGRATGLVGRNGVGKTLLARILAGQLLPASGSCLCSGEVHYLAQQLGQSPGATAAELAGVNPVLDALTRIESGSTAEQDFDLVGDRWDMRERFQQELERNQLGYLEASTPASQLSGGEAMRLSLIGAMLSNADFLVLDEPTNHLDRPSRRALITQLQEWPRGLIVVSHDRQLLGTMERIVELSSLGLHSYGGNYSFYAEAKAHERECTLQNLAARKLERRRQDRVAQQQCERQQRRQARGRRHGKETNQAKVLLDRQKERSEATSAALRRKQTASRERLNEKVFAAAQQVEAEAQVILHEVVINQAPRRRVAELQNVTLPHITGPTRSVNLSIGGRQRVGIVGPNGCGKSTLLKVLAGQIPPVAGACKVTPEIGLLDQALAGLDPQTTVLEQLQSANPSKSEGELRTLLAQLGLDAQKVMTPSGKLSGGERLKAALACLLYAASPPQLLLLDEPSNHLDLASVQALEEMLRSYRGALVVVSHDDVLLGELELTDRLSATVQGWCMDAI